MICKKCGSKNPKGSQYCNSCGAKLNNDKKESFFKQNKKILILIIIILIIIIISVSGAILTQNKPIKTHNFVYVNAVSFNISDELTNETNVSKILFGEGVKYRYSNGIVNALGGLTNYSNSDPVVAKDNDDFYKKIESNKTSQGYETHVYEYNGEYQVYIKLNYTEPGMSESNRIEYEYFTGTFSSLEEVKIFIDTFKVLNNTHNTNNTSIINETNTNDNENIINEETSNSEPERSDDEEIFTSGPLMGHPKSDAVKYEQEMQDLEAEYQAGKQDAYEEMGYSQENTEM